MTLSWYCESSELLGILIQLHESGPEDPIQHHENGGVILADVTDTFCLCRSSGSALRSLEQFGDLGLVFFGTQKIGELKREFDF
jgi:hypothetical protein